MSFESDLLEGDPIGCSMPFLKMNKLKKKKMETYMKPPKIENKNIIANVMYIYITLDVSLHSSIKIKFDNS